MQWTEWRSPRLAQELDQSEITIAGTGVRGWVSAQPVRSISTSFGTFVTEQSNAVQFLDFGFAAIQNNNYVESGYVKEGYVKNSSYPFASGVIVGIELELRSRRNARIQDRTIQLIHAGELISGNLARLDSENTQRYGGEGDRWGIRSDSEIPVSSAQFGVLIDLQPHATIPCSSTVYIDSVVMRVAYP